MFESMETGKAVTGAVEGLRREVRGEVVGAGDDGYDEARGLYVTGFDFRPAAVVRVANAADVSRVVTFAGEEGLPLAVRGGGHSLAGHSGVDGGIVIDLSRLNGIEVDVEGRTAWAGGGATAGEYTRTVGEYGLATGFGDSPIVGIGGITLAGGIGFLHRAFGLTIDNLLAAELVTADGQLVRADADSNPDLFWAIRGGGGNFGVVTRFQYRLRAVDQVLGGMLILPATAKVLHGLLTTVAASPDELSGMFNVAIAPPLPFFPPEAHGKPIIMSMLVYAGEQEAGDRVLAPIRALAKPLVDDVKPIGYAGIYDGEEGPPHPAAVEMRPVLLDEFELSHAEAVLDALHRSTAPMSMAQFRPLGGAVARVPVDATAFPHRQRRFAAAAATIFEREEERQQHQAWTMELADRLRGADRSAYVAFLTDDAPATVREAYGERTWERLRQVKRRFDPENVFRRNHNVG